MEIKKPKFDLRPVEDLWTQEEIKEFDEECELHKKYAEIMIKKHENKEMKLIDVKKYRDS